MTRCAVIVSDVHLTSAGPDAHLGRTCQLPQLLKRYASSKNTELVLAGDVFDYLDEPGYTGWDPAGAAGRMQQILGAHPLVVDGLSKFVKGSGNQISLLAGNHDPEVVLRAVRRCFALEIGLDPELLIPEKILRERAEEQRTPLYGRSLFSNKAWVLHGDRWDPPNYIDRELLLTEPQNLVLPSGSQLVFEVLRGVTHVHPWVYYLEISKLTLIFLLLLITPELLRSTVAGNRELFNRLLRDFLRNFSLASRHLGPDQTQTPVSMETPQSALAAAVAECVAEELRQHATSTQERSELLADLEAVLSRAILDEQPLRVASGTLSAPPRLTAFLRALLRPVEKRASSVSDEPYWQKALDEADMVHSRFTKLPAEGSTLVVGHTHGARWREDKGHRYVNSGTWIPVGTLGAPVLETFIRLLRTPMAQRSPFDAWFSEVPATYVIVTELGEVMLCRLTEKGEEVVVKRSRG